MFLDAELVFGNILKQMDRFVQALQTQKWSKNSAGSGDNLLVENLSI